MSNGLPHSETRSTEKSATTFQRLKCGDQDVAAELYQRYADRLLKLAKARLSLRLARRVDPEDVVQSAYRSFFLGVQAGKFTATQDPELWPLLATIVLFKLRRQAKRHRAARRSIDREVDCTDQESDSTIGDERQPSVVDLVIAAEELAWLLRQLNSKQQSMVELRLEGHTVEQIAETLDVNERTVRRWLDIAKQILVERERNFDERSKVSCLPFELNREVLHRMGLPVVDPKTYLFNKLLAAGGVGKVYAARDRSTGERVCIKVLRKNLRSNVKLSQGFINEVALAATLVHEHIVPVLGIGILADGGLFLVMKQIDGVNLMQRLLAGDMELQEACEVVRQIVSALEYSHAQGILHGDVKPENVLVERNGKALLTDFGLARPLSTAATSPHSLAGTIKYLAPEQISGMCPVGTWTDCYGVGAMLQAIYDMSPLARFEEFGRLAIQSLARSCLEENPRRRPSLKIVSQELQRISKHALTGTTDASQQ